MLSRTFSLLLFVAGAAVVLGQSMQPCAEPDGFKMSLFGFANETTVTAGDPLVLAWVRPSTSKVRALARLALVNMSGTEFPLRRVGRLPRFTTSTDRAGGVLVKSFVGSEPGQYVVRLNLDVPKDNCFMESDVFNVVAGPLSCTAGQVECTSQQAYRRCGVDGWEREELCPVKTLCNGGKCL